MLKIIENDKLYTKNMTEFHRALSEINKINLNDKFVKISIYHIMIG